MYNGKLIIDFSKIAVPPVARSFSIFHYPFSIIFDKAPEVGKNAQSQLLAFFRVKLASKQAIRGDAGNKRIAVIGCGSDQRAAVRHDADRGNKAKKFPAAN